MLIQPWGGNIHIVSANDGTVGCSGIFIDSGSDIELNAGGINLNSCAGALHLSSDTCVDGVKISGCWGQHFKIDNENKSIGLFVSESCRDSGYFVLEDIDDCNGNRIAIKTSIEEVIFPNTNLKINLGTIFVEKSIFNKNISANFADSIFTHGSLMVGTSSEENFITEILDHVSKGKLIVNPSNFGIVYDQTTNSSDIPSEYILKLTAAEKAGEYCDNKVIATLYDTTKYFSHCDRIIDIPALTATDKKATFITELTGLFNNIFDHDNIVNSHYSTDYSQFGFSNTIAPMVQVFGYDDKCRITQKQVDTFFCKTTGELEIQIGTVSDVPAGCLFAKVFI